MKLLHMADIHLLAVPDKDKPWGEGREQLQWEAFEKAMAAAEVEDVDLVLIAGDLFHKQPLKRELRKVDEICGRLTRAKVVIMAGNHDYLTRSSFYRTYQWNENIYFFRSQQLQAIEFPHLNATVYGLSYEHREIRENLYQNIEKNQNTHYHILLAHGGDANHIPFQRKQLEQLPFDYIALGHIHKPEQIVENRIVMAGALQPLEYHETGPRGYWITEWKKGGAYTTFHPIRGFEYVEREVRLTGKETVLQQEILVREELGSLLPYQKAYLLINGIYEPEFPPDIERLQQIESVAAVELRCRPDYNFEKLKLEYGDRIVGRYIEKLEAMPQDEVTKQALYLGLDALMGNMHVY